MVKKLGKWEVEGRLTEVLYSERKWRHSRTLAMIRVVNVREGYFIEANSHIPYVEGYGGVGGFTVLSKEIAMRIVKRYLREYEKMGWLKK